MTRHKDHRVVTKKLSLPLDVVGRVELRLPVNPANTGPSYGAWSLLIEQLLRDWLFEQEIADEVASDDPALPFPEGSGLPHP